MNKNFTKIVSKRFNPVSQTELMNGYEESLRLYISARYNDFAGSKDPDTGCYPSWEDRIDFLRTLVLRYSEMADQLPNCHKTNTTLYEAMGNILAKECISIPSISTLLGEEAHIIIKLQESFNLISIRELIEKMFNEIITNPQSYRRERT